MSRLHYNGFGFVNAITVLERNAITELRTHLLRNGASSLLVSEKINIPYEWFVGEASKVIKNLHPHDFFLNPDGFIIEVPDDWAQSPSALQASFDAPLQIDFLPGIRMRHQDVTPDGVKLVKSFGQFAAPKVKQKIEICVGNSTRVAAECWRGDSEFHWVPKVGDKKILLTQEDLVREVIRLSKIHENDRMYFDQRAAYIQAVLPELLK